MGTKWDLENTITQKLNKQIFLRIKAKMVDYCIVVIKYKQKRYFRGKKKNILILRLV